jgi:hypothetical protein
VLPGQDFEQIMLFMRKLAFQQFSLQRNADGAAIARQLIMFGSLSPKSKLSSDFIRESGISAREFCILSFALLALILQTPSPRMIRADEFRKVESSIEPGSAERFFRFLAKTIPELHQWLTADKKKTIPVADQRILPSPLLDAPLLANAPNEFLIYHPALLMRALESMIYRTLRRASSNFGDFGQIFQSYVADCLDCGGVKYQDERALQRLLPGTGECVDFLVVENESNILIEAKGVEMPSLGKVAQNSEFLMRAIKPSIKAIRQGQATRQRMSHLPVDALPVSERVNTYLMVVTFDDLYLGTSEMFRVFFGTSLLPRLERRYGSPLPIPFDNLFFLSVAELEALMALVREGKTTIVTALRKAQQNDRDMRTQKFQFGQHLESLGLNAKMLAIILDALGQMGDECTKRREAFENRS